jgi:Flp pilus assembly pilin Flp
MRRNGRGRSGISTLSGGIKPGGAEPRGETMLSFIQNFWKDESGQDLIEYTLLMAFVALASASLFISAGSSISGIWGTASNQLSTANGQAS